MPDQPKAGGSEQEGVELTDPQEIMGEDISEEMAEMRVEASLWWDIAAIVNTAEAEHRRYVPVDHIRAALERHLP